MFNVHLLTSTVFFLGWVAYSVAAVVQAVGENTLMPASDCACKVINGSNGLARDNSSWVIGRIVRDFETWMDDGKSNGPIRQCLESIRNEEWLADQNKEPPSRVGLCVFIYKARQARPGHPGYDRAYVSGLVTVITQLALAAIPCGLYGNWGILLVTAAGTVLSFATGALPQWAKEKWICRRGVTKTVVLTRGNGSQHAIVIISDGKGLDFEDLAAPSSMSFSSRQTRLATLILAALWIILLITAAGIKQHAWFLFAVGGIGTLENIYIAGISRSPKDFGVPLEFVKVIGHHKVMQDLYDVESLYPCLGRSMLPVFFPGDLRQDELDRWAEYDKLATERGQRYEGKGLAGEVRRER